MYDLQGKVIEAKFITPKIKFVRVEVLGEFEFKSGQFVNVEVADKFYRSYSICSSGLDHKNLEFVVDITPGGKGSHFFKELKAESLIHFKGPFGRLTVNKENLGDLCFIATGTGIAPFRSIVLELLSRNFDKKISFFWGLRYKEDIFFEEELNDLSKKMNFNYCISLSRPEDWSGEVGHITECLKEKDFDNNTLFYLCGNQSMISDAKKIFEEKGIGEEKITVEKFY